jgi:hypothetical protein
MQSGSDVDFVRYLQNISVTPVDVGCDVPSWSDYLKKDCNITSGSCPKDCGANNSLLITTNGPGRRRFVHSQTWMYKLGTEHYKNLTASKKAATPGALVGANFSPLEFVTDPRLTDLANHLPRPASTTCQTRTSGFLSFANRRTWAGCRGLKSASALARNCIANADIQKISA